MEPALADLKILVQHCPTFNYAFQQNAIPLLREIALQNLGAERGKLRVELSTEPPFAPAQAFHLSALPANTTQRIAPIELHPSPDFLFSTQERLNALLKVRVFDADQIIASESYPVAVLAHNEWCGLENLPEILAAFVLPNDPAITTILDKAATLLKESTGRSALNGYQDRSKQRVWAQLAAIYKAIADTGLRYIAPPPSFENTGQKVCFPSDVLRTRFGTCLDLSLLFAACCERAGLNPLLIIHEGHAYAGCWLEERSFANAAGDDLQQLRKYAQESLLCVIETTLLTHDRPTVLSDAEERAAPHLTTKQTFLLCLDIKSARSARIRPLPLRGPAHAPTGSALLAQNQPHSPSPAAPFPEQPSQSPSQSSSPSFSASDSNHPAAPTHSHSHSHSIPPPPPPPPPTTDLGSRDFPALPPALEQNTEPPKPASRIDLWKSKLLDLSLRNRLINFKERKATVRLLPGCAVHVEDRLASNSQLKLAPKPKLLSEKDPRDAESLTKQEGRATFDEFLTEELSKGRLHTNHEEAELLKRLTELFRSSKNAIEENGCNTLYAAVGMLEWRETDHSDQPHKAPLLLIPVELKRKSMREGYALKRIDEESRLNVTLIEMLRQSFKLEIPGLDPLPEDENGVDVALVFARVREAIRELPGWELHEEVWLAQFSFTKFLLWKDLADRIASLNRNRIVRHLVENPGTPIANPGLVVAPKDLDTAHHPSDIYCPRSADSSQLAAVIEAGLGHDFVLEGPPGTGKSQTITNIIAHCLSLGKRVLFVAEKRAALDVVNRRLKEEGLEPFCLELHSNKIGKLDVLNQFRQGIELPPQADTPAWTQQTDELETLRNHLNAYAQVLHEAMPCGLSAHDCLDYLIPRKGTANLPLAPTLKPCEVAPERLHQLYSLCEQLEHNSSELAPLSGHPLTAVAHEQWSPRWETQTREQGETVANTTHALKQASEGVLQWLLPAPPPPPPPPPSPAPAPAPSPAPAPAPSPAPAPAPSLALSLSKNALEALKQLCESLLTAPTIGPEFLRLPWHTLREKLQLWLSLLEPHKQLTLALEDYDLQRLLALDTTALLSAWETAQLSWFLPKWLGSSRVLKQLASVHRSGQKPAPDSIPTLLKQCGALRALKQQLALESAQVPALLGCLNSLDSLDADQLRNLLDWGEHLQSTLYEFCDDALETLAALRTRLGALLAEGPATLAAASPLGKRMCAFLDALENFKHSFALLSENLSLRELAPQTEQGYLSTLARFNEGLLARWDELRDWCAWQKVRNEAESLGLGAFVSLLESDTPRDESLRQNFERSFRHALLLERLEAEPLLRDFRSRDHEDLIKRFRAIDTTLAQTTRTLLRHRLFARLPKEESLKGPEKAEFGVLKRELNKRMRHIPVRKLLSSMPSLFTQLKPCVLMSPLSVAQYLDTDRTHFDIVIFDEASQIPVWDAIGAIARGAQLIVVGDPKQLPPTNFFSSQGEENDEDAGPEAELQKDLESVLDELMSHSLRHKRLSWHYRSRKEGLIAFSNRHYYDNQLHTFPAPAACSGVHFRHLPEARYDKGTSRTNPAEASALVNALVSRLKDPKTAHFSHGVVTFSKAQQDLVEDLLDEARRLNPEIEIHFGEESPVEGEPVFVKNLENVQGDERDVILFSVCYGPDANGRVSMNFGPLNRDGGERRLNVAITRAKHDIFVFSGLTGEQIDLRRTQAVGVRHLRDFLDYAQFGPARLPAAPLQAETGFKKQELLEHIQRFLQEEGYTVERNLGCSKVRIDLAVCAPTEPGRFILGIECDGPGYQASPSARDRDKLRPEVLGGLGWTLHRIWTPDWWHKPSQEKQRLLQAIKATQPPKTDPS